MGLRLCEICEFMKPKSIFLIRHGESQGNVDKRIYETVPDYALQLTDNGSKQAFSAGQELRSIIGNQSVKFYISPFWRTRQTYLEILKSIDETQLTSKTYEDPRLREQEWGQTLEDRSAHKSKIEEYRDNYGHFYYRFIDGESCADVYDRVSDFMNTLHRDFEKPDYPENVVIVSHGMSIRLFLMRWFHFTVEEFESLGNPKNCSIIRLELNSQTGKYKLDTELKTHALRHPYQFPGYGPYAHVK